MSSPSVPRQPRAGRQPIRRGRCWAVPRIYSNGAVSLMVDPHLFRLRFTWLRKRHDRVVGGGGDHDLIPHRKSAPCLIRTGSAAISARSKSPSKILFSQINTVHLTNLPNPWIQGMEFSGISGGSRFPVSTDAENSQVPPFQFNYPKPRCALTGTLP